MSYLYRKVEQVAEEVDSLKDSLDKYNLRHQRRMQEVRERTELLGRAVCNLFCADMMNNSVLLRIPSNLFL